MGQMIIDGQKVEFDKETNILEVVRKARIDLPTFCYYSELSVYGACRMCIVEIEGRGIQASCHTPPEDGLVVRTNTAKLRKVRKNILELLLANHDRECTMCERSGTCKLQDLAQRYGVRQIRFGERDVKLPLDVSSPSIVRDPNKCILCGDCVRVCKEIQGIGVLDFAHRGAKMMVTPAFNKQLGEVDCVNCGQCSAVCPTGALVVKSQIDQAWDAIYDDSKTVIVQIAPAVRVAVGEAFGLPVGQSTLGQITTALKQMGVDKVFDTSFAADLTVIEETREFIQRFSEKKNIPQFTSCCPAWVKFAEQYYPEFLDNLSSCRSPQQMFGSVVKRYYAQDLGLDREQVYVISIMPCTAKKFEAGREEFFVANNPDVDLVLTTQELISMIKEAGIDFASLEPTALDMPFGFATGAGVIFGNSGGVSEAVLRNAYEIVTKEELQNVVFNDVRGHEGVRDFTADLKGTEIKVAIVNGLANARQLLEDIKSGKAHYDLVEVMACPGGCVGGAGQPISQNGTNLRKERTKGLYREDQRLQMHKSQQNPMLTSLYEQWLTEPGSEEAHQALHTEYGSRRRIDTEAIKINQPENAPVDIQVCVGTSCYLKGSVKILKTLTDMLQKDGYEEDVKLRAAFCCQQCAGGPVVIVDDKVMGNVGFEQIPEIVQLVKSKVEK
ncbi:MAG: 2Fe-2S iron-sulfur cluster binding domain-containing protein [Firmicutes bacterium]|nr:2Fe-2S iron-sulfur cluster binding domain-containing protein [Bacillota bacterium]